jgi:hypothetical protein
LGYSGPKNYLVCLGCDSKLLVRPSINDNTEDKKNEQYIILDDKLKNLLKLNKDIYSGFAEAIAGPDTHFSPSAIYYHWNERPMKKPIIYEIAPCASINHEATINKCRLFADTAQNLFSCFILVVPADCNGKSGEAMAQTMLKENGIPLSMVDILTL